MEKTKILIDTDIGDDIDDALSLTLALKCDNIEIVGITTTFMDAIFRAKIVKKILSTYGKTDVPCYAGYGKTEDGFNSHPLKISEIYDGLYEDFPVNSNPEDAIDFIIDSCYKYGKDLTVVAIGPFTNIAKVIAKDANALKQVKEVVIMGGAYFKQYADWNVFCDPISAKVMFDNLPNIYAVGADVTHKLSVSEDLTEKLINYNGADAGVKLLAKHADGWQKACESKWGGKPKLVLHDPLAIYSVIDKSFVASEKASIYVVTDGAMKGFTFNADAYSKVSLNPYYETIKLNKITVAKEVDSKGFIDKYFDIILNK